MLIGFEIGKIYIFEIENVILIIFKNELFFFCFEVIL